MLSAYVSGFSFDDIDDVDDDEPLDEPIEQQEVSHYYVSDK